VKFPRKVAVSLSASWILLRSCLFGSVDPQKGGPQGEGSCLTQLVTPTQCACKGEGIATTWTHEIGKKLLQDGGSEDSLVVDIAPDRGDAAHRATWPGLWHMMLEENLGVRIDTMQLLWRQHIQLTFSKQDMAQQRCNKHSCRGKGRARMHSKLRRNNY